MVRKITKTFKTTEYIGNCPECGEEQTNILEKYADGVCMECIRKKNAEKFRSYTKYLIGAKIIDVGGECYMSHPRPYIDSVIVAAPNGRQFAISGEPYGEDNPNIEINELMHPIKVDSTIFMDETPNLDAETVKEIFDLIEDKCPPGRVYSKINGIWQYELVGRERTIEEVLSNCAKLRGVHGLSWRTLHEFFWFVSASKWGNRACCTEEEHDVYKNFNGRHVGLNVSFDKMLLDEALVFEEYCENEYGDD